MTTITQAKTNTMKTLITACIFAIVLTTAAAAQAFDPVPDNPCVLFDYDRSMHDIIERTEDGWTKFGWDQWRLDADKEWHRLFIFWAELDREALTEEREYLDPANGNCHCRDERRGEDCGNYWVYSRVELEREPRNDRDSDVVPYSLTILFDDEGNPTSVTGTVGGKDQGEMSFGVEQNGTVNVLGKDGSMIASWQPYFQNPELYGEEGAP